MVNFIQRNINNVKGHNRALSIDSRPPQTYDPKKHSPPRHNVHPSNINHRVNELEKKIYQVEQQHHQVVMEQLSSIKDDIRMIKSHIFDRKGGFSAQRQVTQESGPSEDNFMGGNQRMRSQSSEHNESSKPLDRSYPSTLKSGIVTVEEMINTHIRRSHSNYHKDSISVKTAASMARDYKLESPEYGNIFYGYSKRNSQPVVIKYSADGLNPVLEIYDKLWRHIAEAKWPCINRVVDFRREDSTVMVLQRNKGNIVDLPVKPILIDILKVLEFVHDCGYLYRNIEPQHFMLNEQGQLVIIDFKRTKRYVDIRGHPLQVIDSYNGSAFASNNQVRGLPQSRKDDLESLGYLALLMLQLDIPWIGCSKEQTVKIRSGLTLQQLYKQHVKWVEYMATVMRTPKGERPDYKRLIQILQLS